MTMINNNVVPKLDLEQRIQHREERFTQSDVDQSGTVSKEEFVDNAPRGKNSTEIDKMFDRLDADSDGEITEEEHQAMLDQMTERAGKLSNGNAAGSYMVNNAFKSILETISNSVNSDEDGGLIENIKAQLDEESLTKQQLSKSMVAIIQRYPRIDTEA